LIRFNKRFSLKVAAASRDVFQDQRQIFRDGARLRISGTSLPGRCAHRLALRDGTKLY
jgi:hypothetical protein